jgi:hypothetical protein
MVRKSGRGTRRRKFAIDARKLRSRFGQESSRELARANGMAMDITERKLNEEAIKVADSHYGSFELP